MLLRWCVAHVGLRSSRRRPTTALLNVKGVCVGAPGVREPCAQAALASALGVKEVVFNRIKT